MLDLSFSKSPFVLAVIALLLGVGLLSAAVETRVNAVVDEVSSTQRSWANPANESRRIQSHLNRVIDDLNDADTGELSHEQRQRRLAALGHLQDYSDAERFPQRTDAWPTRRPQFIDDRGVHCAVGELIRDSGDPRLAREIDRSWEFALVADIEHPQLSEWAHAHGFQERELAMIQPMYGPQKGSVYWYIYLYIMLLMGAGWIGLLISLLVLIVMRVSYDSPGGCRALPICCISFFVTPLEVAVLLETASDEFMILNVAAGIAMFGMHIGMTIFLQRLLHGNSWAERESRLS